MHGNSRFGPNTTAGLVALFELTNNEDALKETLIELHALLIATSPIDASKLTQVTFKLIALLEQEEDGIEALRILDSISSLVLDPSSPLFNPEILTELQTFISSAGSPESPQIYLLDKLIHLQETHDAETTEREVALRRRRLGAADLATTKRNVEFEVIAKSKIDVYYTALLPLSRDGTERVLGLKEKLVDFLVKKVKHCPVNAKESHVAQITSFLTRSDPVTRSVVPFEFLINTADCRAAGEYDLETVALASKACEYTAIGLSASGYLKWKPEDFTLDEAMDDLNTITLVNQVKADFGIVLSSVSTSIDTLLAQSYISLGPKFHQDAIKLFTSLLARNPDSPDALHGIATAYTMVQNYTEALTHLTHLAQLDPENDGVVSDIGWNKFLIGDDGTEDDALEWCLRALRMNEASARNHYRVGKVLWSMNNGDSKLQAYQHFLQCVKLDAGYPGAFTAIGLFCFQADGNRARAKKCFEKAVDVDGKDEEAVVELVKLLLEDDEVEQAKGVLIEFAGLVKRSAVAWRYLGFICLKNNEFPDAITHFQTSLRLDTKSVSSWEGLAESYAEEGKYMAALKAFTRA
ncbi:Superkiller protein 3 [Podochytrium sp. JEL0797]|nr:Superkiller protein 3 [Podochytrium sp. JEL0797]